MPVTYTSVMLFVAFNLSVPELRGLISIAMILSPRSPRRSSYLYMLRLGVDETRKADLRSVKGMVRKGQWETSSSATQFSSVEGLAAASYPQGT